MLENYKAQAAVQLAADCALQLGAMPQDACLLERAQLCCRVAELLASSCVQERHSCQAVKAAHTLAETWARAKDAEVEYLRAAQARKYERITEQSATFRQLWQELARQGAKL